jgi:hypothetical protein
MLIARVSPRLSVFTIIDGVVIELIEGSVVAERDR